MIWAFKRSKIAFVVIMALSVLIAIAIWFRDRGHPVFVPIIATVLMLGIGYFSGRVLGNVLASMENTRYLGYLHMELDPEKFLVAYRDVPGRLPPDSADAAICRSYLADGYAAQGDFAEALRQLSQDPPQDNLPLRGLYATGRAAWYLASGDTEHGATEIQVLEQIIDSCRVTKPELAKNLTTSLLLYQEQLNCLTGKPVDTRWLQDAFQKAQYNIRRLEIAKVQAMAALGSEDPAAAKEHLSYLRKNAGATYYKRWADRQT